MLSFIRPKHVDTFGIQNPTGLQLLTRLRLGFSQLNEHKFRHNFLDFLNPLCQCKLEPEATYHFLLRCHLFQAERTTFLNDIKEIDERIISDNTSMLIKVCYMEMIIIIMTQSFVLIVNELKCPYYRIFFM